MDFRQIVKDRMEAALEAHAVETPDWAALLDDLTSDYVLGPLAIPVAASVLAEFDEVFVRIQNEIDSDIHALEENGGYGGGTYGDAIDITANEVDDEGNVYPT